MSQKGSLVSPEGLRFDFSHGQPLSDAEKTEIEDIVNTEIRLNTQVSTRVMTPESAKANGATALFGEKYGAEVRVVTMGSADEKTVFSMELCGGTHARHTGDIGFLRLKSERGVAAGIRRIEAVVANAALMNVRATDNRLEQIAQSLKIPISDIEKRLEALLTERTQLKKQLENAQQSGGDITQQTYGAITLFSEHRKDLPAKQLKPLADQWREGGNSGVYAVIATEGDKASVVVALSDNLADSIDAVVLVRLAATALGGKGGGGRKTLAQAGGNATDSTSIKAAFDAIGSFLLNS